MFFNKVKIIKRSVTLPIKTIGIVFIASGLLLYPKLRNCLSLESITEKNRMYLVLVFIISLSIILVNLLSIMYVYISDYNNKIERKAEIIKILSNLSSDEDTLITLFCEEENNTKKLDTYNVITKKLEYYKIIYKIKDIILYDSLNHTDVKSIYAIDPWVYDYLKNFKLNTKNNK